MCLVLPRLASVKRALLRCDARLACRAHLRGSVARLIQTLCVLTRLAYVRRRGQYVVQMQITVMLTKCCFNVLKVYMRASWAPKRPAQPPETGAYYYMLIIVYDIISCHMICIYIYIERERDIHIHVYIYIYIYIHTHTYIHTYIHAYIHTYIHIYIYIYIYTHRERERCIVMHKCD